MTLQYRTLSPDSTYDGRHAGEPDPETVSRDNRIGYVALAGQPRSLPEVAIEGLNLQFDIFDLNTEENRQRHSEHIGKDYERQEFSLNRRRPRATAQEVKRALGYDLGAVLAIVDLPLHEVVSDEETRKLARFYVVDPDQRAHGTRGRDTGGSVMLVSFSHMEQIFRHIQTGGRIPLPRSGWDMPLIRPGTEPFTVGSAPGNWMPADRKYVEHLSQHRDLGDIYRTVSRRQMQIRVDESKQVSLVDKDSHNGTWVRHSRPIGENKVILSPDIILRPGVDPWAEAYEEPIDFPSAEHQGLSQEPPTARGEDPWFPTQRW